MPLSLPTVSTANGQTADAPLSLTTADAGKPITFAGNGTTPILCNYYDAKWSPIQAAVYGKLPDKLTVGLMYAKARYQGNPEPPYTTFKINVTAVVGGTTATIPTGTVTGSITSDSKPTAWPHIGICVSNTDAGWGKIAVANGCPILRVFGPSCSPGGDFNVGWFNPIKRELDANPTLQVIIMLGPKEGGTLTLDAGDWVKFYAAAAACFAAYKGRVWIEHWNEPNAKHYLPLGQNDGAVSQAVVNALVADAKIRRQCMPGYRLIGAAMGYNANPQMHGDYATALKAAGYFTYIDAYNDHLYPDTPDQATQQLTSVRNAIGSSIELFLTETNFRKVPLASYDTGAKPYVAAIRAANASPMIYRGLPHPTIGEQYGPCLCDSAGVVRPQVVTAWGLK